MSFVGPRPLPTNYKDRYSPEQNRRHQALPGITGWAQVNGRNNITWEKQFELDCWYVDNQSIMLDLKIVFLTILTVLQRKNINEDNQTTRSEFLGNE
jgi:lipopolysaccharide/colanic/teichoic acid biosynthesis glycosyltransferase